MKPRVVVLRSDGSFSTVAEALSLLGGVGRFAEPDEGVLLKPNLFNPKTSAEGATTDPQLIRAVGRLFRGAGARVLVGDCPATAAYARPDLVYEAHGIHRLCAEEWFRGVVLDRDKPTNVPVDGVVLKEVYLPETALHAGVVSLPKLKTHILTGLTCAVKNLFGLQQGASKAHHHVTCAHDPERFAHLLLDIYEAVKPRLRLTVVDAVVAMEGDGPLNGSPTLMNLILAGADPAAIDLVAATLAGWDPATVPTIRLAADRGLGPRTISEVEVVGLSVEEARHPLRRPQWQSQAYLEDYRIPVVLDTDRCRRCAICAKTCPAHAISMNPLPEIDEARCIHCYCCIEQCPAAALRAERRA